MKKPIINTNNISKRTKRFLNSIWLFPAIMTAVLIILSVLGINGSSIGMYHNMLYGDSQSDSSLIFGTAQPIRADEWEVNTQKIIAQSNSNFSAVNENMGNGENETIVTDAPTRDWSVMFKPQNLAFLVLPFENAFSLRWFVMSYLLVLSCYFFVLMLLPKKRLLASLLSLAMLFSPFFQWWYAYGTLGSVYYCLFGAVVFSKLLHAKNKLLAALWSVLLAYIAVCFVLILYPPFQIPCALVLIAFAIGHLLDQRKNIAKNLLKRNLLFFACSILLAISIVGLFVYQRLDIVTTVQNTAYPGQRVITSGGYSLEHLLASNLSPIFQSISRANNYMFTSIGATNQSESSNFILITPFLILPMLIMGYKKFRRDKKIDYLLLSLTALLLIMLAWMFIPGIDLIGKLTLLDKVPHQRLLIGLGLLNFMFIVVFIKLYDQQKKQLSIASSLIYSLLIIIFYLLLDFHVMYLFPNFMNYELAAVLALPLAMIVYCLMRKHFAVAALGLFLFAIASTFHVNPIYQGTSTLTNTPISQAIKEIGATSDKKWASEDLIVENFAAMNGEDSLSGVYTYPQLSLWEDIIPTSQRDTYNRYAHVSFSFDRDTDQTVVPSLLLIGADQFKVSIEPCDNFLQENNLGFIITRQEFSEEAAPCASLIRSVVYPTTTFYIYSLSFDTV